MKSSPVASQLPAQQPKLAESADLLMGGVLLAAWLMAWVIGAQNLGNTSTWLIGLPIVVVAGFIAKMMPGTLASRLTLSGGLMAMVGLHTHLGMGVTEYHFGVFVTLALLLVYRDWRPIVCAAAVISVHHIVIDRLQASGLGVYCMSKPDFARVLLHAGYVVVQTAVEVRMAMLLQRDAEQSASQAESLQRTLSTLNIAVNSVESSIHGVHSASHQIASGSADLSSRTEQTAGQLKITTSLMSDLTSNVGQTAASALTANQLATSAAHVARQGGQVVAGVVDTMDKISSASSKIADIIAVIDGIAFQTNILALNAAVEAARAGEQGRGFAVVAAEVRALAHRSADAAKEIKSLIGASVDQVEGGTRLVQDAGQTMQEIVSSVSQVADIISEISKATQAQSNGLKQVNGAVEELETVTLQNASLAEQSASSANELRSQAEQLSEAMNSIHRLKA